MADALEDFLASVSELPGSNSLYFTQQNEQQNEQQNKQHYEQQNQNNQQQLAQGSQFDLKVQAQDQAAELDPNVTQEKQQSLEQNRNQQMSNIQNNSSEKQNEQLQTDVSTQNKTDNNSEQILGQTQKNSSTLNDQNQGSYQIEDIKEVQNQLKEYYNQMKNKNGQQNNSDEIQNTDKQVRKEEEQIQISDQLADALLANFLKETRDVDRDNEVNRIVWAFKLNPYEQLNLRMDAPLDEVPRQYRKLSLLVHPDKCKHPKAAEAFESLGKALKYIQDDEKREILFILLDRGKKQILDDRRREAKHDAGLRLSIQMNKDGIDGVLRDWQLTNEFHEKWKTKCRELLARAEFRKLKLTNRIIEEEERIKREDEEIRQKYEEDKQLHKEMEKTRQDRVNTWHDFQKKGGSKLFNSFKMPKNKLADEDRLYVQRARKFEEDEPGQNQKANHSSKNKKQKKR